MTNKEIIEAVNRHQNNDMFHPLTFAESKHQILVPVEKNGIVILKCLDRDYEQEWIPDCILKYGKSPESLRASNSHKADKSSIADDQN